MWSGVVGFLGTLGFYGQTQMSVGDRFYVMFTAGQFFLVFRGGGVEEQEREGKFFFKWPVGRAGKERRESEKRETGDGVGRGKGWP